MDFTGHDTKYHSKVPIHCDANGGYQIEGDAFITCLSNGTWSKTSHCALKGNDLMLCDRLICYLQLLSLYALYASQILAIIRRRDPLGKQHPKLQLVIF